MYLVLIHRNLRRWGGFYIPTSMDDSITLITGISGLVGGNLARTLISEGRNVRGLIHRDTRAIEGLEIQREEGDIRDFGAVDRATRGVEVVYHLAASISLTDNNRLMTDVNVFGTRHVVEACIKNKVRRLVHFSSIHAHETEPKNARLDESRPLALSTRNPSYDRSKAAGEIEVLKGFERGLNTVIINPTGILGPYDFKPSHFGKALIEISKGKLPVLVYGGFDWVDVRDVVVTAIRAENIAAPGSKYLLSGNWHSVQEIAEMVSSLVGSKPPRFTVPLWLAHLGLPLVHFHSSIRRSEPLYTSFSLKSLHSNKRISHEKASKDLNYKPRSFKNTIEDTISWFLENGYLHQN
jgi:dihydroflavonol-4-reductase